MNTANLQHEGLLLALVAVLDLLRAKGLATGEEIDAALAGAEARADDDPRRPPHLSAANADAIAFPIRFLRMAMAGDGERSFSAITTEVGQRKPGR
jgi:hypothetical protein